MSVMDYEVGRQPGPPTRARVEVDPITLRVLGGAFHAIAKEMAGVLFRMSYSSIIRESEDLGAGIFDAEGRELCESDSTPMHIGSSDVWLMLAGMIIRPRATSSRTNSGVMTFCRCAPNDSPRC